jgi:hypothetical protein
LTVQSAHLIAKEDRRLLLGRRTEHPEVRTGFADVAPQGVIGYFLRDSTTVVFGCEAAYFGETYLPVTALRALPFELLDLPLAMIHLLTVPYH